MSLLRDIMISYEYYVEIFTWVYEPPTRKNESFVLPRSPPAVVRDGQRAVRRSGGSFAQWGKSSTYGGGGTGLNLRKPTA